MARNLQTPLSETARNIHIYHHDGHVIGGTFQHGSITCSNLYDMCSIFLDFPSSAANPHTWAVFELGVDGSTGPIVPKNRTRIATGNYIILTSARGPIAVRPTEREAVRRIWSESASTQRLSDKQKHFRNQLRSRDQACAVTGYTRADFLSLEAAHIVPVARQHEWRPSQGEYGQSGSSTDTAAIDTLIGEDELYSLQNGLLLHRSIHPQFDVYEWAIDPRDGYKVTVFHQKETILPIDGRSLSEKSRCQGGPAEWRVSDNALRWHFEQAVLKNMKGAAGEQWPDWEYDMGEGGDIISEIMQGPEPGVRMELELGNRLAGWED
ncbi:hypothetical protein BJY01DRAFT_93298 [Aspergillus pseudoustus]|uniref:HNH nuclease domain-containing protein n=1 Tax=Aspergillus pseudoustus TaxID=1810923 RepID=A0ABR4J348_9EURO